MGCTGSKAATNVVVAPSPKLVPATSGSPTSPESSTVSNAVIPAAAGKTNGEASAGKINGDTGAKDEQSQTPKAPQQQQQKTAVPAADEKERSAESRPPVQTAAPTPTLTPTTEIPPTSQRGQQLQHSFKVRPGYSSGASSVASSGSDEDDPHHQHHIDIKGQTVIMTPPTQTSLVADEDSLRQLVEDGNKINHSDVLAQLKIDMVTDGTLAQAVVRIETPFGKPIEEIYDGVHDGPVLGSGVSGIVRLVNHRATGVKYAVKCLDIGLIDSTEGLRQLRDEIFIMCQLDHPNIVRIEEVYESTNEIYIVQELCVGGDLFDRLDEQPDYHYTEAHCARLVKQMLSSVRYLHSKGIIHRDLKLENFLFSSASPDSELKMIDFGLSKHFEVGQHHCEKVGTPYTVAPEIIRGKYDEKSDLWALGVITYLLLSGDTPFGGLDGESLLMVKENILRAKPLFEPADVWENVSPEGKAFVTRLLNPDSAQRPTAKDAQKDPWIQIWAKKDVKEDNKLNTRLVDSLMNFKNSSDMQKLLSEVLSFTLLPEQIVELRGEFEKMDTDGDGEITLSALKTVLLENAEGNKLGALTEQEIQDIFDAIRIRKSEPTIRWHEFLAAGLSQARVDERNLRLAFDRLDTNRKGFITFNDLQDILGSSKEYEELEQIWRDSLSACNTNLSHITFSDFKHLMKGQAKDTKTGGPGAGFLSMGGSRRGLLYEGSVRDLAASSLERVPEDENHESSTDNLATSQSKPELVRLEDSLAGDTPRSTYRKNRSQSLEEKQLVTSLEWLEEPSTGTFTPPPPSDNPMKDLVASPLLSNRALYRRHREMRLAVLDASKQFDNKRTQKAMKEEFSQAGLIMRRGTVTPIHLEDAHTRAMFEAASKRCGRARRTRNKTVSDMTGMLLKATDEGGESSAEAAAR